MIAKYGAAILYVLEWKNFVIWDGRRWRVDHAQKVRQLAKRILRLLFVEATELDGNARKALETHASKSESAGGISAMLTCASSEPAIVASPNGFDCDPWLLNCPNGTLDLRTGVLRAHCPGDRITKMTGTEYLPGSRCDLFLRFINRIMGAHPDASAGDLTRAERLVSYLQRVFGYALTGVTSEKTLFTLFGTGNNGKTTLLEILRFVLGDYAAQILIDT